MDVEDLKKIVQIMNENDLAELEIEEEGKRLRLRKADSVPVAMQAVAGQLPVPMPAELAPALAAAEIPSAGEEGIHTIVAPMVGTFYRAPAPDAENYIEVGQKLGPESVVCILEAMKVMNEIKAECSGTVLKIVVQNAEAVEYGQALVQVKLD